MNPLAAIPTVSRGQFWGLVLSTAGVFTVSSLMSLIQAAPTSRMMSTDGVLGLVAVECAMAAIWLPRLRRSGWSLRTATLPLAPMDLLRGVGLFMWAWLVYIVLWVATWVAAPGAVRAAAAVHIGGHPAWWATALLSAVNPVAEEFLYLGFIARSIEDASPPLALAACTVTRVFVHVYQGPLALLSILPVGLVFGIYYLQSHRIWPAVLAHAAMDAMALGSLAGAS